MQALWSRAGQAHHCGCKACFNAGGMMRQSATRATRRKPTFSEIFTACYTGIMATAAVLDSKVKDDRRLELERQLEEARAELDSLKKRRPRRTNLDNPEGAPPGSIENRYKGALWDHKRQKGGIADFLDALDFSEYEAKAVPRSSEVDRWWEGYGLTTTTEESIAQRRATDYTAWDKWVMAEEKVYQKSGIAHRVPKSLMQLEMSEIMMAEMVEHVVKESKDIFETDLWLELKDEVTALRKGDMPHYQRDRDLAAINDCSLELNNAISLIFANKNYDPQEKVRKVCHNLLVSPRPPTIFTYNTLIVGFNRLGLHPLAQCVVSTIYGSKLEPTRRTMVCLLNHFRESGEQEQFYNVLERMTGKDKEGIKIRRKVIEQVLEHGQLFLWASVKNVAINGHFVIERAWFDLPIFTAIVEGMLSFDLLRHAAATFAIALEYGITFSVQLVTNLLEQCIDTLDMKAARQILDALEQKPRLIAAAFTEKAEQLYLAGRIQNLIDICLLDRSPFSVAPWLNVPASSLPSEEHRRGMRIVSIIHQVESSQNLVKNMANSYPQIADQYRKACSEVLRWKRLEKMGRKIRRLSADKATEGMVANYVKGRISGMERLRAVQPKEGMIARYVCAKTARGNPRMPPAVQPTERIDERSAEDRSEDAREHFCQAGQHFKDLTRPADQLTERINERSIEDRSEDALERSCQAGQHFKNLTRPADLLTEHINERSAEDRSEDAREHSCQAGQPFKNLARPVDQLMERRDKRSMEFRSRDAWERFHRAGKRSKNPARPDDQLPERMLGGSKVVRLVLSEKKASDPALVIEEPRAEKLAAGCSY